MSSDLGDAPRSEPLGAWLRVARARAAGWVGGEASPRVGRAVRVYGSARRMTLSPWPARFRASSTVAAAARFPQPARRSLRVWRLWPAVLVVLMVVVSAPRSATRAWRQP